MSSSPRYMKRKVRAGNIEADPNEMCILVHYDVEATVLGENGEPMESKSGHNVKRIKLTSLNKNSNVPRLAQEIVDKCKLIHPSKLSKVEELCYMLQNRARNDNSYFRRQQELHKTDMDVPVITTTETASIDEVDHYIEMLYDEVSSKVKATSLLLQLVQGQDYLDILTENEPLLSALSRVLRENATREPELTTNILHFFFSLSKFSHFHDVITRFNIGRLSLKVIETETRRHQVWLNELREYEKAVVEAEDKEGAQAELDKQLNVLRGKEKRQERLLFVSVHLLLNIAEDPEIERKIRNKGVIEYLVSMLDRRNLELLILVVTFLKKLSVYAENKDDMAAHGVMEKVSVLLGARNVPLLKGLLRLLFNLSFDPAMRRAMVKFGMVAKLSEVLEEAELKSIVLCLLYHISVDDEHKASYAFASIIPLIREMILEYPDKYVAGELMALAINLSMDANNAALLIEDSGLKYFVQRLMHSDDPLLMKLIRNISYHSGDIKFEFLNHVDDLVNVAQNAATPELQVEALGLLVNLSIENFNYEKLCEEFHLIEFVSTLLQPDAAEDDIILEAVMLIGTVAVDPNCAHMFADSDIIPLLMELMSAKQEDDEIVLQIAYAFRFFAMHEDTVNVLLSQPHAVAYMVDLLQDKNAPIREMAADVLDLFVERDGQWADQIRRKKFEAHNIEWLGALEDLEMEAEAAHARYERAYSTEADTGDDPWNNNLYLDNSMLNYGYDDEYSNEADVGGEDLFL